MPGAAHRLPLILVIDDDEYIHPLLATALRRLPAETLSARTGSEALAIASLRPLDLIVLDLALPDTDGMTLLDALRQRRPTRDVPVVILSGLASHPAARSARVAAFVEKPFQSAALLRVVRAVLDGQSDRRVADPRPLPA